MRGKREVNKIGCLPDDILLFIFQYLDEKQLEDAARVCRKWRKIAFDTSLWGTAEFVNWYEDRIERWIKKRSGSQLKEVDLYRSAISPRLLDIIASVCPQMEKLLLKYCDIFLEKLVFDIKPFKSLKILDIRDVRGHTSYFIQFLRYIPNIELLALDNSVANYWNPKVFSKMPKLRVLECSGCFDVQDTDMQILADSCPRLESLAMNGCYKIDGHYLPYLVQNCPRMKTLSLAKTHITDACLRACSWSQSHISEINFSDSLVSRLGLKEVLSSIPDMKYLSLRNTGQSILIDGEVLKCISKFPSLRALNIDASFAENVHEILVYHVTRDCHFITYLNIGSAITSTESLKLCLKSLPELKTFSITHAQQPVDIHEKIDVEDVLNNLTKYCQELEVLGLSEFQDEQKRRKKNAFLRLFKTCENFKKLFLSLCSREVVIMALDARLLAKRERLEIVQPGIITPNPKVYLPPPSRSFDALVYGVGITSRYDNRKFVKW